ncbi:hypothetical protein ACGFZ6_15825 [Stutzerimonas stutzeri]|uniref:hypothetical protein n=1 Tax=Stutzerimonas stutzeri TaxID=316 RepID=UPI003719B48E
MTDDFDNIRVERETPYRPAAAQTNQHAGLWKQIAIGIAVGHLSLGLIGVAVWMMAAQLLVEDLQIVAPRRGRRNMQLLPPLTRINSRLNCYARHFFDLKPNHAEQTLTAYYRTP